MKTWINGREREGASAVGGSDLKLWLDVTSKKECHKQQPDNLCALTLTAHGFKRVVESGEDLVVCDAWIKHLQSKYGCSWM